LLPEKIIKVLTGIMFSDGHIQRRSVSENDRFIFNQSGKLDKRSYFESVYSLFKFCCSKDYKYSIRIWLDKKKLMRNIYPFLLQLCNYLVLQKFILYGI